MITYHVLEDFPMNLKSCPSGKEILKSLDYPPGLGKAWQSSLWKLRRPFSRVVRTCLTPQIGQEKDNQNQLGGNLKSRQWLLKNPSDWLRRSICLKLTSSGSWHTEIMNPRSWDQVHVHLSQLA